MNEQRENETTISNFDIFLFLAAISGLLLFAVEVMPVLTTAIR